MSAAALAAKAVEEALAQVDLNVKQGIPQLLAWYNVIAERRAVPCTSIKHILALYQRATSTLALSKFKREPLYIQLWLEYARVLR